MKKSEYYEKIEDSLLTAMSAIDDTVRLMSHLHDENHKEISTALDSKRFLKKILNSKFDRCARNKR